MLYEHTMNYQQKYGLAARMCCQSKEQAIASLRQIYREELGEECPEEFVQFLDKIERYYKNNNCRGHIPAQVMKLVRGK